MTATPVSDPAKSFRSKLAGIRRTKRVVPWNQSEREYDRLIDILSVLKPDLRQPRTKHYSELPTTVDPCTGAMLLADFIESEKSVFERVDDSSGLIQSVYWGEATDLFCEFAAGCPDKPLLAERVFQLLQHDEWGIRTGLVARAGEYLDNDRMRDLMNACETRLQANNFEHVYDKDQWLKRIGHLARQLRDPDLFARVRMMAAHVQYSCAEIDIATVYLENHMPEIAIEWIERRGAGTQWSWINVRDTEATADRLLIEAYDQLGDTDKRNEVAWRAFRRSRTVDGLDRLIHFLGEDRRGEIVSSEVAEILKTPGFSLNDLFFMVRSGRMSEAESYVVAHRASLPGDDYTNLRQLGKQFLADDYPLAASMIYRALIDSTLGNARARAYRYAATDLRRLDKLATEISDWSGVPDQAAYLATVREKHRRKNSFWTKYEG